ncbi:MinD/ParA family protein [Caldithrix abyssi]
MNAKTTSTYGTTINIKNSSSKKSEIIAITSGKGGVGKTTIAVNMAIAMQKLRKRVLIIDADLHLGNVDLNLGMRTDKSIADVVRNDLPLNKAIVSTPVKVDLLPASTASIDLIESEPAVLEKLAEKFKRFESYYDYIFIDTGAGIAMNVLSFLFGADKICVVITPDPASITDAYAVIKVVKSVNKDIPIFLIGNMVNHADEGDILYKKMNLMAHKFLNNQIHYGGSLLKDELVARSVKRQKPFVLDHPGGMASNAVRAMIRRIMQAPINNGFYNKNIFERVLETKNTQLEWNL